MAAMDGKRPRILELKDKVEAKEKELSLLGATNTALFDTAAKSLSEDAIGQSMLERVNEVQARARIRAVTLDFLNQYFAGGVVSFNELYCAIDNKSAWKRNVPSGVNLNEFNSAMLEHTVQYGDLSHVKEPITKDEYKAAVRVFHAGLQHFLELRSNADEVKLEHLLKAYEGYKPPKEA